MPNLEQLSVNWLIRNAQYAVVGNASNYVSINSDYKETAGSSGIIKLLQSSKQSHGSVSCTLCFILGERPLRRLVN